ncbi:Permease, YjgP/YjgQ family [uncultured Desulfobacterium sp.]|uniref:Permease, YjgP/YjgQ family n=1 Tax=uncultured Desulfobacterium sp. TaxID=201089 RepID=A0A445MWL8_9BACT|nr:Permease, YjgP/YjgQ family [uncultured Desulfobacterium sp.]
MTILTRYILKEFSRLFLLCLAAFVCLYLVIDFVQKIDNFMEADASGLALIRFFLYKTPLIAVQMAPVASLISVIVMFSLMKKNNEITALKACGLSILRLSFPVLWASLGLAAIIFIVSELLVPFASTRSNDIWQREVKKQDQSRFYNRSNIWFRAQKAIYWIRHFDGTQMVMEDPSFYFFDDDFFLTKKIDAKRAVWIKDRWKAEDGIIQRAVDKDSYRFEMFSEMELDIPENPESFLRTEKKPEEMTYWELKRHAEKTAAEGYDDTQFQVDMNMKLSLPLLSFIMVLIGIPIALSINKGGTPLAVSLGIASCFLYLIALGLGRSLGFSDVLPPMFSAWLASLIFFFLGVYLMMHVET